MRVIFLDDERCDLLDRRRQGDPRCLEHTAAGTLGLVPQQKPLPILLDFRRVQLTQVLDHIGPFEVVPALLQPSL